MGPGPAFPGKKTGEMKKSYQMGRLAPALAALCLAALCSCDNGGKFHVTGSISGAGDSVLYLENLGLGGVVAVDSARLGVDGAFSLRGKAPAAPEFYRLRIAGRSISLSVDSTETITVRASYPSMAGDYEVEGSEECRLIRELSLRQMALQERAMAIQGDRTLSFAASADSIRAVLAAYKEEIKRDYIYRAPYRPSSYFALFQTLGGALIFDPGVDEEDCKAYAAVATSWDAYHPGSERGENLHNIAIEGMRNVRIARAQRAEVPIDAGKVNLANIIDISLLDNKGTRRSITDLAGKVVMLDFHVFGTKESTQRIMRLREVYNKYHDRGFEIFQVSLDPDEHFWKTQTAALPWVCVHDPAGLESPTLVAYNVERIPTFFLVGRDNSLYKRDSQVDDLEAEIEGLL